DLRHRGLAGPARANEEIGVVDLALLDRVAQRADDVLLADDLVEGAGPVAAVEGDRVWHRALGPVYLRVSTALYTLRRCHRASPAGRGRPSGSPPSAPRCSSSSRSASPTTTRSTPSSGVGSWRTA